MMNLSEKYHPVYAPDDGGGGGAASSGSPPPSAPTSSPPSGGSGAPSSPSPPAPSQDSGTPSPAPSAAQGEAFDFGAMFDAPEDLAGALSAPAKAPPAQPAAPPPAAPPQETPDATARAPEAAPAAEPGVAAAAPADKVAPDQSTPQPAAEAAGYIDPYDPAALSQHLAQHEAQAIELVAQQAFQLSPEEKEALEQDVIGTVPKLLAKVFVKSQQNVLTQLGRMIPMMMQRHLEASKRNTANEDRFYSRWPDIKRDKHHDNVVRYAAVYRQMHPQATLDQMIEDLGPMIMMANKIVPSMPGQQPGGPGRQTGTPAAANGRAPQPSPFVPAGAGPVAAPKPAEMEAWEAMFRQQE